MERLTVALAYVIMIVLIVWASRAITVFVSSRLGDVTGTAIGLLAAIFLFFVVFLPIVEWVKRRF